MKPFRLCFAASLLLSCSIAPATAASFEETESGILEAFSKVKSMTADFMMDVPLDEQLGNIKLAIAGDLALLVEGDTSQFLQHVIAKAELPDGVQEMKMTMVCDGAFLNILNEGMGEASVVKTRLANHHDFPPPGAKLLLEFIKRDFENFEVLAEAQVDGKTCHVIEGTMGEDAPGNKIRLYFDKETGAPVKMELFEESSAEPAILRYSNIVINPELKADLFVFTAPDGVEIMDLTQEPEPATEPGAEPDAEDTPVEEAPAPPPAE